MPLPTISQVVSKIQSYRNGRYDQITREILNQIEILNESNIDQFNANLIDLLNDPKYDKKFKKTIYKAVLVLGQLFPRNIVQNGDIIDPITLEKISSDDIFISVDRYHWSIKNLIRFFSTKSTHINPVTNLEFSLLDFYHIQRMAAQHRLTINFNTNVDNRPNPSRRNRIRNLEVSSLLCGFFKHPNVPHQGNVVIYPIPFGGTYVYSGHR